MRRFSVFLAVLATLVFMLGCETNSSETTTTKVVNDEDSTDVDGSDDDIDTSDIETSDEDSETDTDDSGKQQGELYGRCYPNKTCNEGLVCDEENDICIKEPKNDSETSDNDTPEEPEDNDIPETPDETPDTDIPVNPEATENHKISGTVQAGSATTVALYECGGTEKIAEANTDAKGTFSFKADITAAKTYCVKAGDFASCFKGLSDHVANISEITNAAYLLDKTCADLRKSETKIRTYAKLGTGTWLGELDYSKLSGINEGLKLLASFTGSNDAKTLSEKIAEDAKKETPEFAKLFNGFKVSADKTEIVIGESSDGNVNFSVEGGSAKVAPNFKISWTLKNKTAEAATYKFTTSIPGEYVARAKLVSAGDPIMLSQDSSTVLFLQKKNGGTVYVSDTSKNISFRIDDGIYGVIPKGTVVKKNGSKINSISYEVLTAGGSQVSRLKFRPEGAVFEGDTMYFVHELGTVFGGDPIMLSATRTNADGSVDVMNSAAGDPIMMAAAGDPIMTTAAGDPIMQAAAGDPIMTSAAGDPIMTAAAGDPIMTSAAGDPIMTSAAGDPIMSAAAGDPIMTSAAGDPIMASAAGDPIMMGTSSSTMISQTNHYSTFTVEAANLPVSVENLVARWCDGSYYRGYDPIKFIRKGVETYKPAGADKTDLLSYLTCEKFADLGSDLYELINKPVGFQRNLNLIENLFFVSEFYNRMKARQENGTFVAVKNGLELRSAIAALYTATTSYNRSTTFADLSDSSLIPLTYSGATPKDYTALAGNAEVYAATKKEMMIFANYITTSSKGPDFSNVESMLTPDQLVCAWMNPDTEASNCNKVYTLNENGHVALGGTEVSVAEANAVFTKFFMPMNSRLSNDEKLDLFRTFYLALKYAGTIFYNGSDISELHDALLETAYLVFDGINGNMNAVTITDTFDASAHTVSVLDGAEMATVPYLTKLSALTDQISLKVAANSADVEKVLVKIEGKEFEKVQENTRTYYKPTGDLKEKSIVLTPGTLSQGEKALKTLLGSENVDELGNITGKMTIVANSKISGKTYTTQKTYDFFVNNGSDGVNSKEIPANIQIFVNDSTGHAISANANPTIILNPGNKVYYSETGAVSLENLTPAAYTIDAFADGYYAKNVSVNVPAGATFSVEIRLDKELTSSADANLELNININTVKHPSKVYVQIYNDNMDLVANETAKFVDETNKYETLNIEINSGRYTLLAVGEDMYKYLEAITLYEGNNEKTITVVAKNACGNGIVDSAEECEPSVEGSTLEVLCGEIYPASTYPEKTATCDPTSCTFNKSECGKAALCGDGIIDRPTEACDGGSKACAEIAGIGSSTGSAPCAADCSGYITANNCSKTTESCGNLPANALWNDGSGTFTQTHNGEKWLPATKNATFGNTKEECVFSCAKGYKWNGSECIESPLSLALICTGETGCFDNTNESECPAYGEAFFGQDAQYAAAKYCMPHTFTTSGSGNKKIIIDSFTHYEWQAASSSAMTFSQAETACNNYQQENGGSTAVWRLPSPAELLTIIDSSTSSPALSDKFTANGHIFWAKEDFRNIGNAWRVDENGALESVDQNETNSVICVRIRDYDAPENRFTATNETVKDNESGLMWQKQAVASRTWAEALSYCEEVSTADKFDWRLPNRNELASLINYEKENGAMSDFPGIAEKGFWTSTSTVAGNEAWTVDFASGAIEAENKTSTKYIICVRNDEPCFGDECAEPCSFNACKGMANSTGLCTANDYSFTCGCKSGFNWNHGKCLLATTRYIACKGLPENAIWNSVFGISQSYDGENWYPSETGSFNKIASTTECRFICATNYSWDAENDKCLPVTRMTQCGDKKPDSNWNVVSKISQTWDGEKWVPSSESVYNAESSEDECRFVCKEHYTWNDENKLCDPETQPATCTGLPANAHWWNESATITQTWTSGGWTPSATGAHSTDAEENRCFFACNENYEWNNTSCVAETREMSCVTTTDNSEWTGGHSKITQTWNGSEWYPSEIGTYNTESNSAYCRFKCKDNYNWNGSTCVAATQIANCTGLLPNAQWNTVSSITQTYMEISENTYGWSPSNVGSYGDATATECHYTCKENYEWLNNECVGRKQTVECAGLPANATWKEGQSVVEQTWSGTQGWLPAAVGQYNVATGCSFECNENYSWNANTRTCNGAKRNNQQCTGLKENAVWVGSSTIEQTWSGSAWLPSLDATYSETQVTNECHFKCKNNYNWTGSACEPKTQIVTCGTLPPNAQWNMVSQIKQTWNGNTWEPAVNLEYGETASEEECRYTCKTNYEFKDGACTAKKQTVACTGLPANAFWNSATVEQTWDGTKWTPDTTGSHTTGNATDKCYFKCTDENDKYVWNDSEKACVGRTKTGENCTGIKEHAHWNEYSQIQQTWNGTEWFPSTVGSYSATPDKDKCYFVCDTNYQWNGSECIASKQIVSCGTLPANAQWNTVSSIEQTWTQKEDGTYGWQPDNTPAYGNASTEECHYTCKTNFKWENSQCVPKEQDDQNCTGLPANAEWWNGVTSVKQHWDDVAKAWLPTTNGVHATDGAENECRFRCIDEGTKYEWNGTTCAAKPRTQSCDGLPSHAHWNGQYSQISQTWNGTEWFPSEAGIYSTATDAERCYYSCDSNYQWNGSSCVAKTQMVSCGTLPANAVWNTVSQIKQTWNGETEAWEPAVNLDHNDISSEEECRYTCKTNYEFKDGACTAKKQDVACQGLPANAAWNGSGSIEQTWNGSAWTPAATGVHGDETEGCHFKCIDENDKYEWKNNACAAMTKTGQACTDKPANAHWNDHDQINQTWNGEMWFPSTAGTYSTSTDATKCYFSCDDNYTWNGSDCVAAKRIKECSGLAANAQWNIVSSIEQTYQGNNEWSPSNAGSYGAATTTECHYKCNDNYEWKENPENSAVMGCFGKTQPAVECIGLPANAKWLDGHSTVDQTWNGTQGWLPVAVGHHSSVSTEGCVFTCDTNYEWKNGACVGVTRPEQPCTGLADDPANNASWNSASAISQTWNGTEWLPDTVGTYNETTSTTQCRFKCNDNYEWNGSACVGATKLADCEGKPEHSIWNTVSRITQTYNGSEYAPATKAEHCNSTTNCCFECLENYTYHYDETTETSTCEPATRERVCEGLPANAVWRTSAETTGDSLSITQRWNGSDWEQSTTGVHGSYIEGYCRFACIDENTHYQWIDNSCVAMTRTGQTCTDKVANSHWNDNGQISQTWNGTEWFPPTTGSYSTASDPARCYFSCDENYEWYYDECVGAGRVTVCEGLPANAQWNTVSYITQRYNGSVYEPSATASYCNGESSYTNCCFKCLANYTISNDKKSCEPNTRTRSCTGLPANAQWNTSMADGQIIQTWSGSEWIPELTGTFVGQDAPAANSCIFKCAENYEWKGNLCAAKTEVAQCKGLPANAIWNEVASIVRTWQGDDWDLSDRGIYSEETSKTECRFKCKENYTWNGSKCKADKRVMDCKQRPANSVWNIVSTITQTWNGSEWLPKLEPEYIPVPSENECRYTCDTGFYHVNGKCVADPCNVDGYNPCSDIANTDSEHTCKKADNLLLPYSCECQPGFYWWGKAGCRQQAVTLGNICTGLDKCYDGDTETVCPSKGELFYGQDAQYADMGYCAPKKLELKETIVGAQTITTVIDKNTGLEWLSETQTDSWSAAVEYCNNLNTSNYAGHNDWRLPSIKELVTLISYNLSASMIEEDLFGNWNYAWSSTEDSGNSTKALELGLSAGTVYPDYKTWAGSSFTCVRGDELPENDFTSTNVNGEIVIKDENTNLYWQKNYGELIPDWRRALAYCENLVYGGYDDWRVPNINELLSIVDYTVDYTQSMPTINPIFDMPEFEYGDTSYLEAVSSTTGVQNVEYYRSVDFANGHSSTTEKLYVGVLHCVRSDQCDGDLVWTGKECVDNPCGENSCTMENSNGICKPLSSSRFECGCVDGYIWDDSSESCIKDSCSECTTMRGSDGTCTRIDNTKFECGCTEGYFWSISSCRKKAALGSICTGQTQCYSRTGEITCPAEGEDYYGQDATYAAKGACLEKSFTPATFGGEEVVIDNNTGIMWQKYASSEEYTHYQAVSYCADLEYAGYSDWRLPNVVELYSIMDFGEFFMGYGRQVAIDTDYFPAFTDPFYRMWSSVSNPNSSAQARYVWYYHEPQFTHYLPKTDKRYFRCVRGNAMAESKLISWTKNDNEILVDTESGLMFNPTPNWMAWDMALNYCETSNYAGYTDWRLPNINEARLYKGTMSSTRYYLAPDDTDKIYHSEYNGLGLGTETIEDYAFDSEIHCVRSGNVPKDFPINEGEEDINMTCGEIVECENNCYLRFPYDNENRENRDYCLTSCYDESIKNARYLHDDLHTCFNENDSSCWGGGSSFARSHCLASACETELAACFANSGEGPHCTESYDVCYSSESVDSTTDCMGLSQCMDSCGEDYNCRLACQFYTTNDAQRDYDEITWYSEQCANAVDFEGCMIGFGYYYVSSYESCYGVEIDTTCSELSSCIDQCKGNETCKQQCRNNASEAGNYRYDNFQQCIADNCAVYEGDDEAYEECIDDNCWREGRICFAESSKIYSCSNLDWCINNCNGDQVCENNCRKYTTSEGETQYDDLQQCYDEYHDFCISDSDTDGCLRAACRPQYNTCYDIKELNCFELDACRSQCTTMNCIEACNDRASLEAKAQYDNSIDCLLNNCQDFFGTEDFNNCRDTYCGQYEACWDDGCEDGYFWNGSACVIDPCSPNPCGEHSNGVCTATDQDQYSCGCDSGYFWSGSACVDPCNPNPCSSDPNSTGCIAIGATEYTCECQEGYIGINSKCKVPETLWNFEDAGDTTFSEAGNSSQYHWERMTTLGGYSGSYAMCSNNYNVDSSNAVMTITVNMPQDGSASFYIKGSGEKYHGSDFDYFTLYLDGDYSADILLTSYKTAPSDSTNGWSDWTPKSVRLTAGVHTLKFLYQKNSSDYQGDDRFCIDDLLIGYGSVSGSISSCYELMQCYGTCGEGEAYCFSACDNNSTSEAQTQYNDMLTCYAANCMSASAEDFYDCMSTNCPTESANCF